MDHPRVLQREDTTVSTRAFSPLMVRIYSALFLAGTALFLTLTSVEGFAVLIVIAMAAMAWEWGRLVRGKGLDPAFAAQFTATAAACWAATSGFPAAAIGIVIAGTVAVFLIRRMSEKRSLALWSASGVYYAGLPAISLIWLRGDETHGTLAVIYLFVIVWTTDIAAYFFGRLIGGARLAPRISPKKTWAGLIGGVLTAGLAGLLFAYSTGLEIPWLGAMAVGFALVAQLGDLGESAIKRIFGKKDSSSLIPGHGGILDRIDGLVSVAVVAALVALGIDSANPGQALLIW
ncbi:MAG: phosphatidate cytidylyltransferase [Rhodomicrobiaceae bacterium]